MADRFHRLFLRTLRALREHRRHAPTVVVQNAAQVNVGSVQQNVAADTHGARERLEARLTEVEAKRAARKARGAASAEPGLSASGASGARAEE